MISETLLFILLLIFTGLTLFLFVYFIIVLSDLECDYLNSQQCCEKLNAWMIPKMVVHIFLMCLLLVHQHWLLGVANLPLSVYLCYEYFSIPKGNMGVYDPTEIHNSGQLKRHMRGCMIHLGYYLTFFFIYLYCLIISLLKGNPIELSSKEIDLPEY